MCGCVSFPMGKAIKPIKHGECMISLKTGDEAVDCVVVNDTVSSSQSPEVKGSNLASIDRSFQQCVTNSEPCQRFVGSLDVRLSKAEADAAVRAIIILIIIIIEQLLARTLSK